MTGGCSHVMSVAPERPSMTSRTIFFWNSWARSKATSPRSITRISVCVGIILEGTGQFGHDLGNARMRENGLPEIFDGQPVLDDHTENIDDLRGLGADQMGAEDAARLFFGHDLREPARVAEDVGH